MNYEDACQTAVSVAHEAGTIVRDAFPRQALAGADLKLKGAVNPVTETDEAAEACIVSRLREAFPGHRVLAEEGGGDDWQRSGLAIWLIDPLDGTNNFTHGFPHVAISLALVEEGLPVVGVAYDPLRDETFTATTGSGAQLNGDPITVTVVERLADGFLATGFPYDRRTAADNNVERLDHFLRRSRGVRRAGAAVLDLAYVACGRLDGFWEIRLEPWDVAAGILLIQEAGGCVTDFDGGADYLSGDFIVASNGCFHDEMLCVIHEGSGAPLPDA